ncbi:MAG: UDP-3-O-(3-hydroxymyristoyl)glucosamine N-acyltransferase [Pseudomonadota bacterium]
MATSLGEIAETFGCTLKGDAGIVVDSVASLASAADNQLSFYSNTALQPLLENTAAAAVIVRPNDADHCPAAALIHDDPYACYARIAAALHPPAPLASGTHSSAVVDTQATVAESSELAANVVVGRNARIGERCYIGPGTVVGNDAIIGDDCRLVANVTVAHGVSIGRRVILHPGAVVGSDGFGNAQTAEGWVKVPQVGGLQIGDDVEIGANSTIDRGAMDDTIIGRGVRIDNLVQIAHNVQIGDHTAIAAQCGFAGSAVIGQRCMFAGHSGTVGHITVCDDVVVMGKGVLTKDISEPGVYSALFPAEPIRDWNRKAARFRRLDSLQQRVSELEKKGQ